MIVSIIHKILQIIYRFGNYKRVLIGSILLLNKNTSDRPLSLIMSVFRVLISIK